MSAVGDCAGDWGVILNTIYEPTRERVLGRMAHTPTTTSGISTLGPEFHEQPLSDGVDVQRLSSINMTTDTVAEFTEAELDWIKDPGNILEGVDEIGGNNLLSFIKREWTKMRAGALTNADGGWVVPFVDQVFVRIDPKSNAPPKTDANIAAGAILIRKFITNMNDNLWRCWCVIGAFGYEFPITISADYKAVVLALRLVTKLAVCQTMDQFNAAFESTKQLQIATSSESGVHTDGNDMDIPDDAPEDGGNGPMGLSKFKTNDEGDEQGSSDSSDYDSDSEINKAYDKYTAEWHRLNPGGGMPLRFKTIQNNLKRWRRMEEDNK